MRTAKAENLGSLCKVYLFFLFVVLPLHMQNGYEMLGDVKYFFFRNCSVICLGMWLVMEMLFLFGGRIWKKQRHDKTAGRENLVAVWQKIRPGSVDIFVLGYGVCSLVSACLSSFDVAWQGHNEWYMGAVSQLFFVAIYFLISGYYKQERWSVYAVEAAFFVIVVIALVSRLGFDVLGLYRGYTENDWGFSNMLSTLGNINWFCGYCSVILAFPLAGYLYAKGIVKKVLLYIVSILGLVILVIQGSDSGPVLAGVAIGICLVSGIRKKEFFERGLLLATGTCAGVLLMGWAITVLDNWSATPSESWIYSNMTAGIWIALGSLALVLYLVYKLGERYSAKAKMEYFIKLMVILMGITAVMLGVLAIIMWSRQDSHAWGSGRGTLWRLAWDGFCQADLKGKLIGAGPDCFKDYLNSLGMSTVITTEGRWANAVFVNAHNEWLNHLVNLGLAGVICYAGIFIAAWRRYRGMMLAWLMLGMYGVHSLVSFQQVLNTPFLFATLGICEAVYRQKTKANHLTQG